MNIVNSFLIFVFLNKSPQQKMFLTFRELLNSIGFFSQQGVDKQIHENQIQSDDFSDYLADHKQEEIACLTSLEHYEKLCEINLPDELQIPQIFKIHVQKLEVKNNLNQLQEDVKSASYYGGD